MAWRIMLVMLLSVPSILYADCSEKVIEEVMRDTGKPRDEVVKACNQVAREIRQKNERPITESEYQAKLVERAKIVRLCKDLNKPIAEIEQELRNRGLYDIKPPISVSSVAIPTRNTYTAPNNAVTPIRCKSLDTREFGLVNDGRLGRGWTKFELISKYGPPCWTRFVSNGEELVYESDGSNNGSIFTILNGYVAKKVRIY